MVDRALFVEGGGDGGDERTACRKAFKELLIKIKPTLRNVRVSACGSRESAFDDFKVALGNPGLNPCLLVDSEDVVAPVHANKPWDHLKQQANWTRPEDVKDGQAQLMSVEVETWLAADVETLRAHYGKGFKENALPQHANLESVTKPTINDALKKATKETSKGEYHKTRHGFDLVALVNPSEIRRRCPGWAERFFKELESW